MSTCFQVKTWFEPMVLLSVLAVISGPLFSQEELKVGYGILQPDSVEDFSPLGTALFTFNDSQGVLVSQAGVGAVKPIAAGRLFVDQSGTRTALAIVNVSGAPETLFLTLRDGSGRLEAQCSLDFAIDEHVALFVDELPEQATCSDENFVVPEGFVGSLSFQGDGASEDWAAVTLRQSLNQFGQPIFATLPVVDIGNPQGVGAKDVVFPQVGAGGGLSTQIVLINSDVGVISGKIRLFSSAGEPLTMELYGESGTEFDYQIAGNGVFRGQFTRSDGQVGVGYALVSIESGSTSPSGSAIFQFTTGLAVISEAGVGATPLTRSARIFVDNAGTRTGVALASPENTDAEFSFRLLDRTGQAIQVETRDVPAQGHLAIFADEIFPDLPAGFTGLLEITSDVSFAPVTLKLTINSRSQPILTTLPVVDLTGEPAVSPLYLPQVGFGLGFSTKLILINASLAQSASGSLILRESDGSDLVVPISGQNASIASFSLEAGSTRQFYPGVEAELAEILVDSANLTVNQGSTIPLRPITLDELGNPRDDFVLSYQSLNPDTVTVDQAGNITALNRGFSTIVVSSDDLVRRFVVTSGTITSNFPGFQPTDVVQDFSGRIFLANSLGHTILLAEDLETAPGLYAGIDRQAGLRGGHRQQALFNRPAFLAYDQGQSGELYVSDTANHVIRQIDPGLEGEVTILAGRGQPGSQDGTVEQAGFSSPQGLALDDRGFLWVADSDNHTIRRIDLQQGSVVTVAGQAGVAGFADGMGSAARFNTPKGLAFEAEIATQQLARELNGLPPPPSSVLVADSGNNVIRRVWESGAVETLGAENISGASASRLSAPSLQIGQRIAFKEPTGLVLDPFGNLYVSEGDGSGNVRVLLRNGDTVLAAERGTFSSPGGMATTIRGRILVAESNRTVQQIRYAGPSIATIQPSQISTTGGTVVSIQGNNIAPESIIIVGDTVVSEIQFNDTTNVSFVSPDLPSGRQILTIQHRGGLAQSTIEVFPPEPADLQVGEITTIVGGTSDVGDGRQATSAQLRQPLGLAVSAAGDILVSDRDQHRIRRIAAVTGIISTVAGTGRSGSSAGGLPAILSDLNSPSGAAITPDGNLVFADSANHSVRLLRLDTGTVEMLAGLGEPGFGGDGGAAIQARLHSPEGIAVDGEGAIWIADTGNHRIRRLDPGTGFISTVVGTGEAGFSGDSGPGLEARLFSPKGLGFSPSGELLIADTGNHVVRKLSSDGLIDTVAGTGVPDFTGDGIPAVETALSSPADVAVDADGNVFVADSANHRIRRLGTDGILTTFAGNGLADFGGDGGNARSASLNTPLGLDFDAAGNLLVADSGNFRVRRIRPDDQTISTIAGSAFDFGGDGDLAVLAALARPAGMAYLGETLLIADQGGHRIRQVLGVETAASEQSGGFSGIIWTLAGSGRRGDSSGPVAAEDAEFNGPTGLAVTAAGDVLFSDRDNHRIRELSGGTVIAVAGTGVAGYLDDVPGSVGLLKGPAGVALDLDGGLIFADTLNHRLRKLDPLGFVTPLAGNGEAGFSGDAGRPFQAQLSSPQGVFVSEDGRIFISDTNNHRIRVIDGQRQEIQTIVGTGQPGFAGDSGPAAQAQIRAPAGLYLDRDNALYFADSGNHRVRRVDLASGIIRTVAGSGIGGFGGDGDSALDAQLSQPWAVLVDAEGNLLIGDLGNQRIRWVRLSQP